MEECDKIATLMRSWSALTPRQLVEACSHSSDVGAWEEFMRRYHSLLQATAVHVSRRWSTGAFDEIDDLVQEIYLRICAERATLLTNFKDQHPDAIFAYLKVLATNIGHDFFRRRSAQKRDWRQTASLTEFLDIPGPVQCADLDRSLTIESIERALCANTESANSVRDRTIFRLYYRHGMTAQAISALPGIGLAPKGVEGVLFRLTRAIRLDLSQESAGGSRPKKAGQL